MKQIKSWMAAAAVLIVTGCASGRQASNLPAVGPAPAAASLDGPVGYLVVYSDRDPVNLVDQDYALHSSYRILADDGTPVRTVENHTNPFDAQPARIRLQPGLYRVRAQARGYGWVTVPVAIREQETTAVRLDGSGDGFGYRAGGHLVRLPDGNPVGWAASLSPEARR